MSSPYFVRRDMPADASYEETYWGGITDPDGRVRDRRQERDRSLEDIKVELGFINALPPGRILDVGCGLGFMLSGVGSEWERHGVEVSAFAANHASAYGQIFQGTLEEAAYPDEYFDLVVIYHVIEHVREPQLLIKELRRILKSDGWLILGTPDFDSGAARRFGDNYRLLHDVTHISLFSNDSMHRFLRDHGFRVDRVEYPYFETRYFNQESLLALFDTSRVSPPFYGNFMTFYCRREPLFELKEQAAELSNCLSTDADALIAFREDLVRVLANLLAGSQTLRFKAEGPLLAAVVLLVSLLKAKDIDSERLQLAGQGDSGSDSSSALIAFSYLEQTEDCSGSTGLRVTVEGVQEKWSAELACKCENLLVLMLCESVAISIPGAEG